VKTKTVDAAMAASDEMVRAMTEDQIQYQLRTAMRRARIWYRLHGKHFALPTETKRKTKR